MGNNAPHAGGSYVTTPLAATMIALLGPGEIAGGLALTRGETQAIAKLYGFKPEPSRERPPKPEMPQVPDGTPEWTRRQADDAYRARVDAWERWQDPRAFHQAGADRNMIRHAQHDGLRLLAWLAKYIPPGEDPLKSLVQLAMDAGLDVNPADISWAQGDGIGRDAAE